MVWLTSLECNCIEGWVVSWFILRLVSMYIGQSLVRWSVSLLWYMEYKGLRVYDPQPQP
jgi:hypothetical protein